MSTLSDAWQAGIDAVIADNTINRQGFVDAIQTVVTQGLSNQEGNDFVDAVAAEYNRLGSINNPTFNNLRGDIISRGDVASLAFFNSVSTIQNLPETKPVEDALELMNLREERDNIDAAIDRCNVLIAAEPPGVVGRLVKEVLRQGKENLRGHKEEVRNQIRRITGDPDS